MDLFSVFAEWLKGRLHIKPTQLKGTPGVHDPSAAAAHVNSTVGTVIDTASPAGVLAVENALKLHPDQLKGAPGISDHAAAADTVNAIVQQKLGG